MRGAHAPKLRIRALKPRSGARKLVFEGLEPKLRKSHSEKYKSPHLGSQSNGPRNLLFLSRNPFISSTETFGNCILRGAHAPKLRKRALEQRGVAQKLFSKVWSRSFESPTRRNINGNTSDHNAMDPGTFYFCLETLISSTEMFGNLPCPKPGHQIRSSHLSGCNPIVYFSSLILRLLLCLLLLVLLLLFLSIINYQYYFFLFLFLSLL